MKRFLTPFRARLVRFAFAGAFSIAVPSAWSASVKTWEIDDYKDFLPGDFENAALEKEGVLTRAPKLSSVHESDQAAVWCIAVASD